MVGPSHGLPLLHPVPVLLFALSVASAADQSGLVVRVDLTAAAAHEGDVVVHLKGEAGVKDIKVFDDGATPDVTAGDGVYSGTTWIDADTFDASLSVGATVLPGGPVSWDPANTARDLNMSVAGQTLTAEAAAPSSGPVVSGSPGPQADAGSGPTPPAPPDGVSPPPSGATAPGGAPTAAAKEGSDPMLYIGLGVGLLLMTGLVYTTMRGRRGGELKALPEPGLLGPFTPSLTAGLSVWEVGADDASALADALLATAARHRRVIVAADATYAPAPVFGGPVYRAATTTPAGIQETIEAAEDDGGPPIAVLIHGATDPARLKAIGKILPAGVGALVVTAGAGDTAVPVVRCRRGPDGVWSFVTPSGEVRARLGPAGLEPLTG